MKINNIIIENFGIYKDINKYDLTTKNKKNIVLISGENGAGKTTLLNAIKLCLYGPRLLGYKTESNPQYRQFISKKLNAYALTEENNNYSISINFELNENGQRNNYIIKRHWTFESTQSTKAKEHLSITKNNQILNETEADQYAEHIHQTMPLNLFELFFFDGEKVGNMFLLKEDLSTMLNNIFRLELFSDLKLDLKKYMKQKKKTAELSNLQKDKLDMQEEIEELDSMKLKRQENIDNFKLQLIQAQDQHAGLEKYFKSIGGLNQDLISEYQSTITDLTLQKESFTSQYKSIINETLPFIMFKNELSEISRQMKSEMRNSENKIIHEKLNSIDFQKHIKTTTNISQSDSQNFIKEICSFYSFEQKQGIFDHSSEEIQEFDQLYNQISEIEEQKINELFNNIESINIELLNLKKQLEKNQSDEYKKSFAEIENKLIQISKINEKIQNEQVELDRLILLIETKSNELKKIEHELLATEKDLNLDHIVSKCQIVLEKYIQEITSLKRGELETYIAQIFTQLIRKEDFIQKIKVDSITGKIILINKLGEELPKENLSAGEKQLYILSVLYGMIKVSEKNVPLVFDTLLGRLDKTHKSNIVQHFLSTAGEQVIILATDSEIDDEYRSLLSPYINKYYSLDYDNQNNKVLLNQPNWEVHHEL